MTVVEGEDKVQDPRKIPCEVYSRVVGYLRRVSDWNLGRQQEWLDRVPYTLGEADGKSEVVGISRDADGG